MCSCRPCFLQSQAIKFVILNETKQQFLKLNWHLAGWQQATKANIWGREIKMKSCKVEEEKKKNRSMRIIEQQQNDCWDEIEFHLRSDVFAACCTSSCFSLKSFLCVLTLWRICQVDPRADMDTEDKWIKQIYCQGSWKWRCEIRSLKWLRARRSRWGGNHKNVHCPLI